MTADIAQGTVVYCVARAKDLKGGPPLQAPGLAGTGVRLIPQRDLVAIAGDSNADRYRVSRDNVKVYREVIDEVMQRSDVLPFVFGEVAPNDEDIAKLLADNYDEIVRGLDRVHGRVELSLKVNFDEGKLFDELRGMHPDLVEAARSVASVNERIDRGREVAQVIDSKREREAERLIKDLRPLAAEITTAEITSDMMVLNASLLVDRDRLDQLDERMRKLGEREAGRMTFRYVGPLAPFSFVGLHLKHTEEEAQHAQ